MTQKEILIDPKRLKTKQNESKRPKLRPKLTINTTKQAKTTQKKS